MIPFATALSILRVARARAAFAATASPEAVASLVARIAVLTSERTALLRSSAFKLVPMRLMLDLMFAMVHFLWRKNFGGLITPITKPNSSSLERVGQAP